MYFKFVNRSKLDLLCLLLISLISILELSQVCPVNAQSVFWSESWEGSWTNNWYVDAGTWEVGAPTSGPPKAYEQQNCAATVLDGVYSEPVDSKLIRRTSFVVPPASENPRLRFWHWYSFSTYDYGVVQIKVSGGDWTSISPDYYNTGSGVWTYPSIDLSDYADSTVQISFYFHSHRTYEYGSKANVSSGWYIDDVSVVTGPINFNITNNPESFESGMGDWFAEKGTWEIGAHSTYSGQNGAATVLNGNYAEPVDSRLISPPFTIPNKEENPRLRFWHWYSFSTYDYGVVQIKVSGGSWKSISPKYYHTGSGVWTYPSIDLSTFADSTVQISFYFHSHRTYEYGSQGNISLGWYIDDLSVVTGLNDFNNPENFESGIGDWFARRGTWEIGEPIAGPDSAHSPPFCAGTVLKGNYKEPVDSRLVSPPLIIPNENAGLLFWHWYSFSTYDYGVVQIKVKDGDWQTISDPPFTSTSSNKWTPYYVDLSAYADSTVKIAFYFHSHRTYEYGSKGNVSTGWYIDDLELQGSNQSPVVDSFTANPTQGKSPLSVSFTCQAHDPDGSVVEYRWDFDNDGSIEQTTTNDSITYTYQTDGTFNATCTVVDNDGLSKKSFPITIKVGEIPSLIILIPDTTVKKGATFDIPIEITDATGVAGIELKVTFDAALLDVLKVEPGSLMTGFSFADTVSSGSVAISMARATGLSGGSGNLAVITFLAKDCGTSQLTLQNVSLFDQDTIPISDSTKNGSITIVGDCDPDSFKIDPDSAFVMVNNIIDYEVVGENVPDSVTWQVDTNFSKPGTEIGSISPEQGTNVTFTATNPGDGYIIATAASLVDTACVVVGKTKGDVNLDDKINVQDAILCLQLADEYNSCSYKCWAADFNDDYQIYEDDALRILYKSLEGLLPKFLTAGSGPANVMIGQFRYDSNDLLTVPILIDGRKDVHASGFEISYNPELLSIVDAASATSSSLIVKNFKEQGMAKVSLINASGLVNSHGEVLTLRFKSKAKLAENLELIIKEVRLFDRAAQPIEAEITTLADEKIPPVPTNFGLHQNYPNPFNPTTTIQFDLPTDSKVRLTIFNLMGQKIATLASGTLNAGSHSIIWNSRDDAGHVVPSGVYIYRISVEDANWQKTKKMVFLK